MSIDQFQWLGQIIASEASGSTAAWSELRERLAKAEKNSWLRLLALGLAREQSAEPWFAELAGSANTIALDEAAPVNDRLVAIGLLKYLAPKWHCPTWRSC